MTTIPDRTTIDGTSQNKLRALRGRVPLSWVGHQVHVSLPINQLLDAGVDPKEIPLPHEFNLNCDFLVQLFIFHTY